MLLRFRTSPVVGRDEILAALARVCSSPPFKRAPQLKNFLRFAVEMTLAGQADRLKGYTIGLEALGRSDDFDPQIDPIVRVEAIRLRAALARYYAVFGIDDPIVIGLPPGGYVPCFGRRGFLHSTTLLVMARKIGRWLNLRLTLQGCL